jgi:hypothetical protein
MFLPQIQNLPGEEEGGNQAASQRRSAGVSRRALLRSATMAQQWLQYEPISPQTGRNPRNPRRVWIRAASQGAQSAAGLSKMGATVAMIVIFLAPDAAALFRAPHPRAGNILDWSVARWGSEI